MRTALWKLDIRGPGHSIGCSDVVRTDCVFCTAWLTSRYTSVSLRHFPGAQAPVPEEHTRTNDDLWFVGLALRSVSLILRKLWEAAQWFTLIYVLQRSLQRQYVFKGH